jgi:hypothetical protein
MVYVREISLRPTRSVISYSVYLAYINFTRVVWMLSTNCSATEAEESDARSSRIRAKLMVGDGALES